MPGVDAHLQDWGWRPNQLDPEASCGKRFGGGVGWGLGRSRALNPWLRGPRQGGDVSSSLPEAVPIPAQSCRGVPIDQGGGDGFGSSWLRPAERAADHLAVLVENSSWGCRFDSRKRSISGLQRGLSNIQQHPGDGAAMLVFDRFSIAGANPSGTPHNQSA